MAFNIDPDYVDVAQRIKYFYEKFPDGSLRPLNPEKPFDVLTVGDRSFVVYAAAAFRTPDDPSPSVGVAYEPFPGRTPYTKDSELQNAETSAWGRAIVASGASASKKIASADDVRNRAADRDVPEPPPQPTAERIEIRKLVPEVREAAKLIGITSREALEKDYALRNGGQILTDATAEELRGYAADLRDEYAAMGDRSVPISDLAAEVAALRAETEHA